MSTETCYRCGRATTFRFWSWADGIKVAFCTWFCARAHHQATGKPVENDKGEAVSF